jgi:hypothetical protein
MNKFLTWVLFNLFLFVVCSYLIYSAMLNINVFLVLPFSLKILVIIGIVTPLMNLYDTLGNIVHSFSFRIAKKEEDHEDSL